MIKKTVLITGSSSGIGKAIALKFAKKDYNVVITYNKSKESAEKLLEKIRLKTDCILVKCDLENHTEISNMYNKIKFKFGGVDILINNAGVASFKQIQDYNFDEIEKIINTNLTSYIYLSSLIVPYMISKKEGRIINMSSIWGVEGASCEVVYSCAKAGIIGLTKSLARELGSSNITVNCIAPGLIATDMNNNLDKAEIKDFISDNAINRVGKVNDVAELTYFLSTDKAEYITGQVIKVAGNP